MGWMNKPSSYVAVWMMRLTNFRYYDFEWNVDYTEAQIYSVIDMGWFGAYRVPKELISFTMVRQYDLLNACPPSIDATRYNISRCAKFDRVTEPYIMRKLGI